VGGFSDAAHLLAGTAAMQKRASGYVCKASYFLVSMAALISPAQGQDDVQERARACSAIAASLERLACFDGIYPADAALAGQTAEYAGHALDPYNTGGLSPVAATSSDGDITIDIFAIEAVRNVRSLVLKENDSGTEMIAEGSLEAMNRYNRERIASLHPGRHERTRFMACMSFQNISGDTSHLIVSFLEEQPSAPSGQSPLSTASHYAAPISLLTDGTLSCDEAASPSFIAGLPHASRIPPARTPLSAEEIQDGFTRESILQLMADAILSNDLYYNIDKGTQRHLADVEFVVTISPVNGEADPIRIESRTAYMPAWSGLNALEMMGPAVAESKLPWDAVRFDACAAYFDVAEQRYLQEQWTLNYSLAEMRVLLQRLI
jgi:hypothetical protein